ncbi:MAG: 50S ribosomal protein L23 [Planctomycetota bacterium]
MDAAYVVKKPILTEKSTAAMEEGKYTFLVDRTATKVDVKRAIEQLYGVKVEGVATQVRKGKVRRYRYGYSTEASTKKATVTLAEGAAIELF